VKDTKGCPTIKSPKDVDCVWNDWSDWSGCTCTCNGGQKTRDRSVKQAPRGIGKRCEIHAKSEVAPCNTHPCSHHCVDGLWSEWSYWDQCTASCGGGIQWRTRHVKVEANWCGKPVTGKEREVQDCNTQACEISEPCLFGQWGEWSACSCSCGGMMHRSRRIEQYGQVDGSWCVGPTKEISPCNNVTDIPECRDGEPTNCILGDWGSWDSCTATCSGGQQTRKRTVVQEAKAGGKSCKVDLTQADGCNQVRAKPLFPVDCNWHDWQEWSACDKCGGQRKRSRNIKTMPNDGGQPCSWEAAEETAACPRECHGPIICEWSEWEQSGGCSSTCGTGVLKRTRRLVARTQNKKTQSNVTQDDLWMVDSNPLNDRQDPTKTQSNIPATPTSPSALYKVTDAVDASDMQDVAISFVCGSVVTFLMLFVGTRTVNSRSGRYSLMTVSDGSEHIVPEGQFSREAQIDIE